MIPFKTQYEKLVNAYMNNEVKPNKPCACFIGNLLNRRSEWYDLKCWHVGTSGVDTDAAVECINEESLGTYTPRELLQIEGAFMRVWERHGKNEDSLFRAFEHALILLRQVHESKGEVIVDYTFKKRQLEFAN